MKTRFKLLMLSAALLAVFDSAQAISLTGGTSTPALTKPRVSTDPRIVDLGVAPASDVKTISLALAVRNSAQLDSYIASLSDPASPTFRQFLTPQQFAASYGQTADAVATVVNYLKAQGFKVNKVYTNNLLISATGTNAQIAAALHRLGEAPLEGRRAEAEDRVPEVSGELEVLRRRLLHRAVLALGLEVAPHGSLTASTSPRGRPGGGRARA